MGDVCPLVLSDMALTVHLLCFAWTYKKKFTTFWTLIIIPAWPTSKALFLARPAIVGNTVFLFLY